MGSDNSKPKRVSGSTTNGTSKTEPNLQQVLYSQNPTQQENLRHAARVNNLQENPPNFSYNTSQVGAKQIFPNNVHPTVSTSNENFNRHQLFTGNIQEKNLPRGGKLSSRTRSVSKERPKSVNQNELGKIKMDISILLELSNKESSDIVRYIIDRKKVFENTILDNISQSVLVVLMKVVRKICLSNVNDEKVELLKIVCQENFLCTLGNYLLNLPTHSKDCAKEDLLFLEGNVLPFFETILSLIPDFTCSKMRQLLIQTNLAINGLEQYQELKVDEAVKTKLKKMESAVKHHLNLPETSNQQESSHLARELEVRSDQKCSISVPSHSAQSQAKHLQFLTHNVFPRMVQKFDVPAHRVRGMLKNIYFVDNGGTKEGYAKEGELLLALAAYLLKKDYKADNILFLTTSESDMKNVVELKNHSMSLKDMRVGVINNFEEFNATITLISFAVNDSEEIMQSIYDERQLCKALLEAKNGIYMAGNLNALEKQSSFWKEMRNLLQQYKALSFGFPVLCELHQIVNTVSDAKDFKKFKNGGCSRTCDVKLKCGHICRRICHFDDREHKKYNCRERCLRKPNQCSMNHTCPKLCHENCGLCTMALENNGIHVMCHELSTSENVGKATSVNIEPLSVNNEKTLLPCSHYASSKGMSVHHLDMWSLELVSLCQVNCTAILECGHTCTGTCGSCRQGRVHMPCRHKRKITLACGHRIISTCSAPVLKCDQKCFYECPHGMCKEKCGVPCTPCKQMCTIGCEHSKCTKMCYELCDRRPCFAPCKKLLSCGHQCIGLCGEPCPPGPENCKVCNAEKLKKRDSSGEARFVLLSNCHHVVRSNDLDRKAFSKVHKVETLTCPICGYNITKVSRYLNHAKELHRNLLTIRFVQKQYTENLTAGFWNIAKEIRSMSLPQEVENHAKMEEIKKQFQVVKDNKAADLKAVILLMFLRNLLYCSIDGHVGMASPHHFDWLLYVLLERYEMGLCSQVLRELYKEIIEYQKLKGTVFKKYLLELHKAIAFFTYLERNTWIKCSKGHLTTSNSLLTECGSCDGADIN